VTRCEELGISAYLTKPIRQSELFDAIMLAMGASPESEDVAAQAAQRSSGLRPLNILLAEDSLVNQKLAVALLESHGHRVTVVSTGREAVAAVGTQPFDVVLMDVQMPEMDGLVATAAIRARESLNGGHIPVVAMTAHALKGDRERCLEAGMDDYIAKPIHAKELFAALANVVPGSALPPAAALPDEVVDWGNAMQAVENNSQVLGAIVDAALEEIPRLMGAIRDAVAAHNADALRLAAHTLKGSLRYFGAGAAFQQVCRLEKLGQEANLAEAPTLVAELETAISAITAALHEHAHASP
jgi:CheY-like chemotaxis protein